ncbi:MAG: translesion error-prone DNA polymerase V autoproteolytic subunit [Paludibacter sp.]|nr:translesion error-prone DNA polymerase V autoproteolytic subunit [Paludibacter sp.]
MNPDKPNIKFYTADTQTVLNLPYASEGIKAGFPSPAQDYLDIAIDLNKELIRNPASTFFGRVSGDSMRDEGLDDGDILIVDKSLEPQNGDTAVCFVDGDFTLKYIRMEKDQLWLVPANPAYPSIRITEENNFMIWGIVTYSVRHHRKRRKK